MSNAIILLVEDNIAILEANKRVLSKAGYTVLTAKTLADARADLQKQTPDTIVLDICLPDGNGLDFISEIRAITAAPVLILTSLSEKDERINGLRAGGDDYITKPYDVDELRERVAAFLRRDTLIRETQPPQSTIICGPLTLDITSSQAFVNGTDLLLAGKEFALLLLFVKNEGVTIKSEELYQKVWKRPMLEDANALKVAVSRLRKKLIDTDFDIMTVRGEGYLFERQ